MDVCVSARPNVCVFALLKCLLNRRAKHFLSSAICGASAPEMINWHLLGASHSFAGWISGEQDTILPPSLLFPLYPCVIYFHPSLSGSGLLVIIVAALFLLKPLPHWLLTVDAALGTTWDCPWHSYARLCSAKGFRLLDLICEFSVFGNLLGKSYLQ